MDDSNHRPSDEKQLLLSTTTAAAGATTGTNSLKDDHHKKNQQLAPKRASNKDRHTKVDGRSRRIRMPALCAARVFQLTRELGHKTDGETIQWLLQQAEPAIMAATGTGTIPASFLTSAAASISSQQGTSVSLKINDARANNWANFGDNLARSQVPTSIWPSIGGGYAPVFDNSPNNAAANLGTQNSSYVTNFQLQGVGLPAANMGLLSFTPILTRGAQIPGLQLGLSQDGHGVIGQIYQQQQEQQQQHQQQEHEEDDDVDGDGDSEAIHQHQQLQSHSNENSRDQ